jgi:hypothetical protein
VSLQKTLYQTTYPVHPKIPMALTEAISVVYDRCVSTSSASGMTSTKSGLNEAKVREWRGTITMALAWVRWVPDGWTMLGVTTQATSASEEEDEQQRQRRRLDPSTRPFL